MLFFHLFLSCTNICVCTIFLLCIRFPLPVFNMKRFDFPYFEFRLWSSASRKKWPDRKQSVCISIVHYYIGFSLIDWILAECYQIRNFSTQICFYTIRGCFLYQNIVNPFSVWTVIFSKHKMNGWDVWTWREKGTCAWESCDSIEHITYTRTLLKIWNSFNFFLYPLVASTYEYSSNATSIAPKI